MSIFIYLYLNSANQIFKKIDILEKSIGIFNFYLYFIIWYFQKYYLL